MPGTCAGTKVTNGGGTVSCGCGLGQQRALLANEKARRWMRIEASTTNKANARFTPPPIQEARWSQLKTTTTLQHQACRTPSQNPSRLCCAGHGPAVAFGLRPQHMTGSDYGTPAKKVGVFLAAVINRGGPRLSIESDAD